MDFIQQLVRITSELRDGVFTPHELEQSIQTRPKKKPLVQVIVSPDLVQVKYKKLQKHVSANCIHSNLHEV